MRYLFRGDHLPEKQKIFKNSLQEVMGAANNNLYSLNAFKHLHNLEKSVFVAHRGIMSARNGQLVYFLYN